ncbi:hypothetical protein BKA61DRAFT_575251 [Leptodontidium sp. MPI-SDFR-AT-0119]|nr:hypothetical protein BKA61DRAFT_575251 [Leptodontidium sp. MPI-SDFR-AT-0119]
MPHCRFCTTITFHDLPGEEEEAVPHQPSLDALIKSAEFCSLCKLILWAIGYSLSSPGGIVTYKLATELLDGSKATSIVFNRNYNTTGVTRGLFNGAAMINIRNA